MPITSLFCLIVFISIALPIMRGEAERDEATVAAQWTFGQLFSHTNDTSIGYVTQKTIYHDGVEDLSNVGWFEGIIDDVLVYNSAFDEADFAKIAQPLSVKPGGKYTTTWGNLKSDRID